ncbi:hypothetical protein BC332_21072 [Capsicum chinense]|nr:hypothetical protein BC332_21072 [Capsicum chinense]
MMNRIQKLQILDLQKFYLYMEIITLRQTTSAVAGTFGYIAPEYEYSFGVVLMELTTGKEPVDKDEHMNLTQ